MNIPVTRAAEGLERRAFTISDLERMVKAGIIAPEERLELLGGEIVPMSPKGSRHEIIKVAITLLWGRRCPDDFAFGVEAGLRLNRHNYVEPDFIVFPRAIRVSDVKGPDVLLAVEVADSSLSYDLDRKPLIYAQFGVRELWVVDAKREVVHRRAHLCEGRYTTESKHPASERLVPVEAPAAFAFSLDELEPR
jgi:Uma2 family endonuclease